MVVNMSGGQYKPHYGFNPIQIKDGYIVRLRKNGTIAARLDTWPPSKDK
jgi:hypothetical protein